MPGIEVIEITAAELIWPFDGTDQPYFSAVDGTYTRAEKVDPFPCYAHDLSLVRAELERTSRLFPIAPKVYVYVSRFEGVGRTNAHASPGYDYQAEMVGDSYPIGTGTIVLNGKRIPIHPAMTRYLVSHEYGHLVEYWLTQEGRLDMEAYAAMRGVAEPRCYGGGTWHLAIAEIFANDFRLMVAEREAEFWPHDCPRPDEVAAVAAFWRGLLEETRGFDKSKKAHAEEVAIEDCPRLVEALNSNQ